MFARFFRWLVRLFRGSKPTPRVRLDPNEVGVVMGNTAGQPERIDKLADTGVGWVRLDAYWHTIQLEQDRWVWWIEEDVLRAKERGLKVYMTLHRTPAWATDGRQYIGHPDLTAWGLFVEAVIHRLAPDAIGVWNEPNGLYRSIFYDGTLNSYLDLVRTAHTFTKDEDVLLCAPEISATDWTQPRMWADTVVKEVGDLINVLTVHHYGPADETAEYIRSLPGKTPVWLTETAYSDSQTREEQAEHLRRLFWRQSQNSRWQLSMPFHWYTPSWSRIVGTEAEKVLRETVNVE